MNHLEVFLDENHSKPGPLEYYLYNSKPRIVFFQMSTYEGLETDLRRAGSLDDFDKKYKEVFPTRDLEACVYVMLNYVMENKDVFFNAVGMYEQEVKENIIRLIKGSLLDIEGLGSLIIGSGHESFVKKQIEPLFKGFEITYLMSSSCPSCSK
jgi:hypothetical protein